MLYHALTWFIFSLIPSQRALKVYGLSNFSKWQCNSSAVNLRWMSDKLQQSRDFRMCVTIHYKKGSVPRRSPGRTFDARSTNYEKGMCARIRKQDFPDSFWHASIALISTLYIHCNLSNFVLACLVVVAFVFSIQGTSGVKELFTHLHASVAYAYFTHNNDYRLSLTHHQTVKGLASSLNLNSVNQSIFKLIFIASSFKAKADTCIVVFIDVKGTL